MNEPGRITDSDSIAPAQERRTTRESMAPERFSNKSKRTLTWRSFPGITGKFLISVPVLLKSLFRPKVSAALREKIMLGVTSINNCRFCEWGHTHWAMARGVPLEEVNQILGHDVESLQANNPGEAAAILFARHYAENLDRIDPESLENLRQFYTGTQIAEILAYVRTITLGSLTGNTLDAILDRFRRKDRAKSGPQSHPDKTA